MKSLFSRPPSSPPADSSGVPAGYITRVAAGSLQQTNEVIASYSNGTVTPVTINRRGDEIYLILFGTGLRYAPNTNLANDIALAGGGTLANVSECGSHDWRKTRAC
ncbi:MAG: hypothetical protein U0Y68_07630 [Blastocatellia bacterium]